MQDQRARKRQAQRRRVVSVCFPDFATDRLTRLESAGKPGPASAPASAPERPLATVAMVRGAHHLAAVDGTGRTAGLTPGLPLAEARALAPGLRTAPADPTTDAAALKALARWAGRYTPWTAVDDSAEDALASGLGGLWLDISGAAHLFGGEDALLADLCRRLAAAGYRTRAAAADTPGAAWAAARFATTDDAPWRTVPPGGQRAFLAPLPVAALRLEADAHDALHRLGLRRVGDLYPLARAALAVRFGPGPGERLDQALGRIDEPLSPLAPAPAFRLRLGFPEPIGTPEDLAAALERLLPPLAERLERAARGARRVDFTLFRVDGTAVTASIGTGRPTRDVRHLRRLFTEKLATLDPGFGVETALLAAPLTQPLPPAQAGLPGDGGAEGGATDGLGRLLDRLGNRLGGERVVRLMPRDSHLPERAQAEPPAATPGKPPPPMDAPPRPLHLLPVPEPVDVLTPTADAPPLMFRWRRRQHRVAQAEGPERIAPEWWRDLAQSRQGDVDGDGNDDFGGRPPELRDYYRVEDAEGGRFWLYRAGPPLPGRAPRWYLHGVFP